MREKLTQGLTDTITKVASERESHYRNGNPLPTIESIKATIKSCSYQNAMISGGASLVPGPLGMAAAIPEIILVTKNQINMVYDIAKAHGHKDIAPELLIGVLFGAMGQSVTAVVVVQGQRVMAKRVGAKALQELIKALGGKITQQMAKSMAAKWFPGIGAVAMAGWSKYSTTKIGEKAIEVFSKEIEFEINEIESNTVDAIDATENKTTDTNIIQKTKIEALISLMKIDGKIEDSEVEFLEDFIGKTDISSDDKIELIGKISSKEKTKIDYTPFRENKEEGLYLLIDLIALAKADGQFHITEKMLIKEIASTIGFGESDVKELME